MYGTNPIWQPSRDNPCDPYSRCYSSNNNDDFGILYVMISLFHFSRISVHIIGTQLASQNVANIVSVTNPTTMTILASLILPSRFFSLLGSALILF